MVENKYYIDENGLITVIQSISDSIVQHTSGEITFTETEDPETGETEKVLDNPNNFPTVEAVTEYLKNRKKLDVLYESNTPVQDNNYETVEHHEQYNGEEEVQLKIKLITADDIKKLFR